MHYTQDELDYIKINIKATDDEYVGSFLFELENLKEMAYADYHLDVKVKIKELFLNSDEHEQGYIKTKLQELYIDLSKEFTQPSHLIQFVLDETKPYQNKIDCYSIGAQIPQTVSEIFQSEIKYFKAFCDLSKNNLILNEKLKDSKLDQRIVNYYIELNPFHAFDKKGFIDNLFDLEVFINSKLVKNKTIANFEFKNEYFLVKCSNVTSEFLKMFVIYHSKTIASHFNHQPKTLSLKLY